MKPFEFSLENAIEALPDDVRRTLTAEARKYAEEDRDPRYDFGGYSTYWDGVILEFKRIIWMDAFHKRKARLERLGTSVSTHA
jgi:hypothetical protein